MLSNRNCFKLLVKMISASPIAGCPSFKFLTMQMQPSASCARMWTVLSATIIFADKPHRLNERTNELATFRRKIGALGRVVKGAQQRKTRRERPAGGFTEPDGEGGRIYRVARFSIARPMLMRLSAMTPRPTQRFIPASPL